MSESAPIVPLAERDAAVKLCCAMFNPYATGCVAVTEHCVFGAEGYCLDAWKRGATLADIDPGLRKIVKRNNWYMPRQCMAPAPKP